MDPLSFLLLILSEIFQIGGQDEGGNIAFQKPVYGRAKWPHALVDGKYWTVISPQQDELPLFYVDLLDLYLLRSVRVHSATGGTFAKAGLNISFSVYTWDNFTTGCDIGALYPWHVMKSRLIFTKKGQEFIIPGPIEARYIIVMPDQVNFLDAVDGITISELRAFGVKIADGYVPKVPEDGPEIPNLHIETRRRLMSGQSHLRVAQSYGEYKQSLKYDDVALAWHDDKINTMAVVRDKARIILMSGATSMELLASAPEYATLRSNFRAWLSPEYPNASFVKVTDRARDGNILLITRTSGFNEHKVYDRLMSGKNAAVIGYIGSLKVANSPAARLMAKLHIGYASHRKEYAPRNISISGLIKQPKFIPFGYRLKLATESWKVFRTENLYSNVKAEEVRTPEAQEALRKLIDKYRTYFKEHPICRTHPYQRDEKLDLAFENYNRLLTFQLGSRIEPIPGSSRTPGDLRPSENSTCYTVTFNVSVRGGYYPMGGYAKPGHAFRYKVLNVTTRSLKGFRVRVNPQTDTVRRPELRRWFTVTSVREMEAQGEFASPFGGPIVIEIPVPATIIIHFENVYRYPWFDIRNPESRNNWEVERLKHRGVPYLMLVGNNMISMIATSIATAINGEDFLFCVNYHDNVIKMIHNYRGTDYTKDPLQVFVTDEQISAGDGHSGYPWMGHRYWGKAFLDRSRIESGKSVNVLHEIGHNLQVKKITFARGGEVTNSLYIPVLHHYLLGLSSYGKGFSPGWSPNDELQLLATWRGSEYIGVQVSYYNYLHRYFTAALVSNVIGYAVHSKESFDTEERKVNFWMKHLCIESGYDLVPFNRLWHLPINDKTAALCNRFPCFFPDDELTQQVPDVTENILMEYNKSCSREQPEGVQFKRDIMRGVNVLDPQIIFIHSADTCMTPPSELT
ncbi:unnamed protein product [Dicrocoelium dendriticum]|nr:unnamed protein product [Dicrocoelium dendriticum]